MANPPKKAGRPKSPDPKQISLATRGTAAHYRALKLAAEQTRGRSVSTEILIAIEEHLTKLKLWPPPPAGRK